MRLTPDDDHPHGRGSGESWQENYLFMGIGDDDSTAMFVHVARLPALGFCDVKLAVKVGEELCSFTQQLPWNDGLSVEGFRFDIEEPWVRWHVRAEGRGRLGGDPGLLLTTGEGDVPTAADFYWEAEAPPVIQSEGFEEMDSGGAGSSGHHYVQGGRWHGRIQIGDREVVAAGWSIRDHTWGERDVSTMKHCWWTPMVFDDGTYQLAGIDMHTTDGGRVTFSYERDSSGQRAFPFLDVEITDGDLNDYRRATIRCGDELEVDATRIVRMPIAYTRGGGVGWVSDDALCRLRTADGRVGFGIVEINRLLTNDEIAALPPGAAT